MHFFILYGVIFIRISDFRKFNKVIKINYYTLENRNYPVLDDFAIRFCLFFVVLLYSWGNIFVMTKENSHSKTGL